MKEDYIETLRQQDTNLRDAIRLEEEAMPPMPADLNARLMQRVEEEREKKTLPRALAFGGSGMCGSLDSRLPHPTEGNARRWDVNGKAYCREGGEA